MPQASAAATLAWMSFDEHAILRRQAQERRRVPETPGLNCVPARQREAERSGRIQRDAGELRLPGRKARKIGEFAAP
jgi:hypothetical protein